MADCHPTESRVQPDHCKCLFCRKELDPIQYCISDSYYMGFDLNDEEIWVDNIYHLECYGQTKDWGNELNSAEEFNEFELLNDIGQETVMKSLWPYQVRKEMRPKLNLS